MAEEFHNVKEKRKNLSPLSFGREKDLEDNAYKMTSEDMEKYRNQGKVVLPIIRPGYESADAYCIPETGETNYTELTKRVRVFTKGNDKYEQDFKPPQIIRELYTIKEAVTKNIDEAAREPEKVSKGGIVELDKKSMEGLIKDPVYINRGPVMYVAFLEHYVERTAKTLHERITHAEKVREISILPEEEIRNYYLNMIKHDYGRFARAVEDTMLSYDRIETYHESDAGGPQGALGKHYVYKLIIRSGEKYEMPEAKKTLPEKIGDILSKTFLKKSLKVKRSLREIFEGLHGLGEKEFAEKFGKSKNEVLGSIGEKFYKVDLRRMYEKYEKEMKEYVRKMDIDYLRKRFTGGKTYRELIGEKSPDELRKELDAGTKRYMDAINEVSELFMPEQWEEARRVIREEDKKMINPLSQREKDALMRQKHIKKLEGLETEKSGQLVKDYIKGRYKKK